MRSAVRGIEPEPPHVGCYGSGVQCAKFFGEIFARPEGHPLPIGWGEGQGEGSSEILQTGLDRVECQDAPAMRQPRNRRGRNTSNREMAITKIMKTAWFKRRGWFYQPVSWQGVAMVAAAL